MTRHAAGPRADTLVGRVEAFFRANPEEWLTLADGAAKFDCKPQQFHRAVKNLQGYGWADIECIQVVRLRAKDEAPR